MCFKVFGLLLKYDFNFLPDCDLDFKHRNLNLVPTYFIFMMATARLKQPHMPLAVCRCSSNDTATKRLKINNRLWCPQCTPVLIDWNRDAMIKEQTDKLQMSLLVSSKYVPLLF